MEEWVGQQWHRAITRLAERGDPAHRVRLEDVQRPLAMLFRAGGGAPAVRVAPVSERAIGGPRGWLQRIGGSGTRAARPELQPDVLALPPALNVFADKALNRDLYLWLAALAAHWQPGAGWLADNRAATALALAAFPGLAVRHARLQAAQLALRPDPQRLRGRAAQAEARVQAALRGEPAAPGDEDWLPTDAAPVWLWLDSGRPVAGDDAARTPGQQPGERGDPGDGREAPDDRTRRHAERVKDERHKAPLMMFFRAESILSWGEFTKVQRADDDEDDGNALAAAQDMDTLSVAEASGQRPAAKVRFDLDLPSAAHDDLPLGEGERQPEWDFRSQRLVPERCAVQRMVVREAPAFTPPAALRQTAGQVRRRLELLRAAPARRHAQPDGEELDLDAWVRHATEGGAERSEAPAVWQRRVRDERSLATLLLADLSLSTDAHVGGRGPSVRVIEVIRDALYVFGEALAAGGDQFEMIGFSSVRRQNVRVQHLKGFDEPWGGLARARVGAVKPGYYTRMGAAIRHATARLHGRPERQKLLLLLTDGKPNDLDVYEGRYGLEDTRHALQEARAAGCTPFAVTIDRDAHDYLPLLFGQQGYALVHQPRDLPRRLASVYAALTRR